MGKLVLPIVVGVVGLVFVVLAVIAGWVIVPNIIEDKIKEEVRLINGSETWDKWQKNPVDVYLDFYIWHVTNADAVNANHSVKPDLQELGPYVFRESREKINITIDEENDTIKYKQPIRYDFDAAKSGGNRLDTDTVNIVNGAFLAVAHNVFATYGPGFVGIIDRMADEFGERLVVKDVMIKDLLFDGWKLNEYYEEILNSRPDGIPVEFTDYRFGYYRMKNNSHDGEYVVSAGVKKSEDFGKIQSWEGESKLDWWYPPTSRWENSSVKPELTYCNMINGTDGTIFAPFVKKDTVIYNFITDVCRSAFLVFKDEIEFKDIPGYKFGFSDSFYEDPAINGDNYCFCPSPVRPELDSSCTKGVIRIFPCKHNAPIVTSSPHYLHADPTFITQVTGMSPPEDEKHETFVQLEPNSGHMLKISKKVQINLEIQPIERSVFFNEKTPTFMFPAFWANENVELDDHLADDLKSKLVTPMKIADIAKWTILGLGSLLMVISGGLLIFRR